MQCWFTNAQTRIPEAVMQPRPGIEQLALRLQVSYNGAATWAELTPPDRPTFPECSTCRPSDTCKLHLHGPSSWHYGAGALLPAPRSFCALVEPLYRGSISRFQSGFSRHLEGCSACTVWAEGCQALCIDVAGVPEALACIPADARPSFYSHEAAPGVVMAVGNTGEYLDMVCAASALRVSPSSH